MADPVTSDAAPALEQPAEQALPASAPERSRSRLAAWEAELRRRFGVAYLVLAIVVGAAAGLFIVFLGRGDSSSGSWSTWRPTARGLEAAQQIASHVGGRYRLLSGERVASVIAGPPQVQNNFSITWVQIRSGYPDELPQDVKLYKAKNSVVFQLCGLGQECAIPGQPSIARAMLLRQEILELSLYTFKYVDGVDSVIVFAPPTFQASSDKAVRTAAFLREGGLTPQLDAPLRTILPERGAQVPTSQRDAQHPILRRVNLNQYEFAGLPDGTALLVLAPPPTA